MGDENSMRRVKKFLHEELDKFKDIADVDEDSDIPVTEKKAKERMFKE